MQLAGFRVRMYRSIRDSGYVPVFPLTALVGRKQSGKTTLLRVLRGLNLGCARPYNPERDWPRGSRSPAPDDHVVCSAAFRLAETEMAQWKERGVLCEQSLGIHVARTYGGELLVGDWGENEGAGRRHSDAGLSSHGVLIDSVRNRLPRFLYAEHDSWLPGPIDGDSLAQPGLRDEGSGIAALGRLAQQAGLEPDALRWGPPAKRVREAGESIRAMLKQEGFPWALRLKENRGLIEVLVEHGGVLTSADQLPPDQRFRLALELRIVDARRSAQRNTVLLLDGPGRWFRRPGRASMRDLFHSYSKNGLTVLYTSRMPFQVELQHPEQVLVLAPAREGALVAPSQWNPEAQLAVRAALGMNGRPSFTIDDLNLVVEGLSDARILRALDELLRRSNEQGLPVDIALTNAQGAEEVAHVSTFLGRQGLGVIALFDSDAAGFRGAEHLRASALQHPRIERLEILHLAEAAGIDHANAAIEDVFPVADYMEAAREACDHSDQSIIARVARGPGGNPGARLSRAFEEIGRRFPKSRVIEALAVRLEGLESMDDLSTELAARARKLVRAVRLAADRLQAQADSDQGGE